jgi:hypothetical protein
MKNAALLSLNRNAVASAPAAVVVSGAAGRCQYVRRLSPIERCSLVLNAVHRYNLDAVVDGHGYIDPQDLQAAVRRAAEANPAIRVRLRGVLGFCRWVDSGVPPLVSVVSDSAWDGKSSDNAGFMTGRLDPVQGGPVSDIFLVSCRDGRQRVVFRAVHAAIDGRAMLHWMQEVFRALRGEELLGSRSTLTDWDIQKKLQKQVTDTAPPLGACLPVVAPGAAPGPVEYLWRRIVIDHNVSHPLAKAAVFLANWARRQGDGEVGFTVPVDYRGLRTEEMGMGNLTGFVQMSVAGDEKPRAVMQHLNKRIRDLADCRMQPVALVPWLPLTLLVKMFLARLDALLYSVGKGIPTAGIVSMGLVRAKDFVCAGFEPEYVYGIPGAVGKLNVVFVNYGDATIVSFAAPKAYNHAGQLDEMIAAFRQHFSSPAQPATP